MAFFRLIIFWFFPAPDPAAITRFHPRTISRLARTGQIPGAFQVAGKRGGWRFKRTQFEKWWNSIGE